MADPIDLSKVKWDEPSAGADIDLSQVKWDQSPTANQSDLLTGNGPDMGMAMPPPKVSNVMNMSVAEAQQAMKPEAGRAFATILPQSFAVDEQGNRVPGTAQPDLRAGITGDIANAFLGGMELVGRPYAPPVASSDAPVAGAIRAADPEMTLGLIGNAGMPVARGTGKLIAGMAEHGGVDVFRPRVPIDRNAGVVPNALQPRTEPAPAPAMVSPRPVEPGVGAAPGDTVPQSVGAAATPETLATPSTREQMVQQRHGERLALQETPQPNDVTVHIEGIQPTRAEITQNPMDARLEKQLRMENPQPFMDREIANNEVYRNFYADHAGTEVTLDRLRQARSDQAKADIEQVFGRPGELRPDIGPADATPVLDHVKQILATEDGKRPEVRAYMEKALKELYDSKGNLETDPKLLYGARKNVDTLLSAQQRVTDPLVERVEPLLKDIRGTLDSVIEGAVPGYRQYMDNYAANSRPIDKQELLQKYQTKIETGPNRVIRFGEVDRMLRDIVAQRSARGNTKAQSLTEEDMAALLSLRASLARTNAAERLARAKGSDTAQNLHDRAGQFLKSPMASHIVGQVAGTVLGGPGLGNMVALPATHFGRQIFTNRQTKNALFPDLSKVPNRYDRNAQQ